MPIIFVLVFLAVAYVLLKWATRAPGTVAAKADGFEPLLRKCFGDKSAAERLIEVQRSKTPSLDRGQLIRQVLDRLNHENR